MKRLLIALGIAVWIGAAAFGYFKLVRYENAPGTPPSPPGLWPSASTIHRASSRATLMMVVHPLCSCTRASIEELALAMDQAPGLADVHVLFFKPPGFTEDWARSDLWTAAAAIPGVQVQIDNEAKEAKLFHATTSGSVVLYDRDGHLQFTGGITPSRAHAGDNAGRTAIIALLTGGKAERTKSFVFGCSLLDTRQDPREP